MTNKIKLSNVKISFSTMLNKPEKAKLGRVFKVLVPLNSPEFNEIKEKYTTLSETAQEAFSAKLEKKIKKASTEIFNESIYHEGCIELPFNIFFNKDGEEKLNPIYQSTRFCYFVGNNGEKIYETENGKKIFPLSNNTVDIEMSLVAKYNSKDNRPTIMFKAEDVKIVESDYGNKSSGPKTGFITLDGEEDVPVQVEKAEPVKDDMFEADDMSSLDM